jgi:hypothetical protein
VPDLLGLPAMRLVLGFFFIFQAMLPVAAQEIDIEAVKNALAAGHCPAGELSLVSANERCDPDGATHKTCDRKSPAASPEWQRCYADIEACRKRTDDDNAVIRHSNEVYRQCMKNAEKAVPPPKASAPPPKASAVKPSGDEDISKRLEAAKARGASAAQEARKQNEEFEVQGQDINKREEEQHRLQSKEEIEKEAAARDLERTERDIEDARKYVCFTSPHPSNYHEHHICQEICWELLTYGYSTVSCRASCMSEDTFGRHCALIVPNLRPEILARVHRGPFRRDGYVLPDK